MHSSSLYDARYMCTAGGTLFVVSYSHINMLLGSLKRRHGAHRVFTSQPDIESTKREAQ